ncbi:DNA polymerase family A [uncultured archaeon]|nr:DNA polymerase family A [uncultured archaeon]
MSEAKADVQKHIRPNVGLPGVLVRLLRFGALKFAQVIKNGLVRVAELEFETISSVVEMELSGIYLDSDAARALIKEKEAKLVEVFMDLQDEAKANGFVSPPGEEGRKGYYLNPESQDDVKKYLRSQGFNVASTKADVLKELAAQGCVFAKMLLRYRQVSHLLAFLDNWLQQIQAATGRLSSRKPNAQQIPRRGEEGTTVRRLFKATPGKKIVKADFSAIELRIMAYLSGDETMQKALQEGRDLHRLTASRISGLPLDQVTDAQRQAAKTINFLLIYGGSAQTLQWRALSDYGAVMCLDEACEMRDKFFETYSGVKAWHEKQILEMSYTHQHYFLD